MAEAQSITTSRRAALVGGATALLLGGAAAQVSGATSPDAALLAACEELQACDRAIAAMNARPTADIKDEEIDDLVTRWDKALDAVSELPATTPAGIRAKAAALLTTIRREVPTTIGSTVEEHADSHEWLAYRLAEDIVALAGGAA